MTENMKSAAIAINKWVFFAMNYPHDFIEKVWADNKNLAQHLRAKFNHYHETYGSRAVMNTFYCELDGNNKRKLMAWVLDNYNDEQKINFNTED